MAFDQGVTVRRGQGYTLRVTAAPPSTASSSTVTRMLGLDAGTSPIYAVHAPRYALRTGGVAKEFTRKVWS